jgi:hypothetical protein
MRAQSASAQVLLVAALVLLAIGAFSSSPASAADYYKVTLTYKDTNWYKVENTDLFIRTRFCYEYVYYKECLLKHDGDWKVEINDRWYDVEGIYQEVSTARVTHSVALWPDAA